MKKGMQLMGEGLVLRFFLIVTVLSTMTLGYGW